MKKIAGLLMLMFCLNTTYGQILSLKDLIKINEMSFEKFHTYCSAKRYKLYEVQDDKTVQSFSYAFGQNRANLYATRVVTKSEYKTSKKRMVSYQMLTSGDYYSISNQIANKGVLLTSAKTGGATKKFQIYRLDKNKITLITDQGYDPNGAKILYYQVLVSSSE